MAHAGNPNWKKGQSGNPSGCPKGWFDVKKAAEKHSEEAIQKIYKLMNSAEDEKVQAMCAIYLLDRAHGKPPQAVEVGGKDGGPLQVELVSYAKDKNSI